jgi:FKBP-type peptidyl-prolyl cis-trans isomerase 2
MRPIFDPEELTLATEGEKKLFNKLESDLLGYMNGEIDGVKIRQEIAGCAVFAKLVQTRGPMAMVKYDREKRGTETALEERRTLV